MTENESKLYALLGRAVCSGMDCQQCHNLFNMEACPQDFLDKPQLDEYIESIIDKLQGTDVCSWTDEDFYKLLMGD